MSETDDRVRCGWSVSDPQYIRYHDREWGVPVHDERLHFEFLVLEGAQAGLSWLTVLKKRQAYRLAYDGFDPHLVAAYDDVKRAELLANAGIVRNRLKVASSIENARHFLEVQKEFGSFDKYIWAFVDGKPVRNHPRTLADIPATSELSDRVSKDLKKRGFRFVGSTIIYAHLQATGIINDHLVSCFRSAEL